MKVLVESVRYLMVTVLAFLLDYVLLYAFTSYTSFNYLIGVSVGFLSGMAFQYSICVMWVFDERRLSNFRNEFLMFGLVGAVGLLLNSLIIFLLVELQEFDVMLAKLSASAATLIFNFVLRKFLLFYVPKEQRISVN